MPECSYCGEPVNVPDSHEWRDGDECWECQRTLRPKDEWHEDDGVVLWFRLPLAEPPYVGTPLCSDFPDYATHWCRLPDVIVPDATTSFSAVSEDAAQR